MQETGSVLCPFCGQYFDLVIETSQPEQQFTIDCEICCRPLQVSVTCEAGEIVELRAAGD
jgi:hypothetical protein